MEFESPDVEKDFPGLYASDATKKGNESDFSDENPDKSFKKELIGKRKEKKDSKKDRGYAALEGESSPDEEDSKSPSKSKKSKAFKFPSKKSEKREKSREKEVKEKETEKEKKKEKDKKEKEKVKVKEKKGVAEESHPVFGVPLATAVERGGCLDGVAIPAVVRECIDCIHQHGLTMDGLYKVAGIKSKVQALRKSYNMREPVTLCHADVSVATCLLKMYLRELPEPLLTNDLLTRFEEAGAVKEVTAQKTELQDLCKQLPQCNRILLAWLIIHFDAVTMLEKSNKINAQSIAMTFSPVLQMSHRLLAALLCHCKALFPTTIIYRYIPPLAPGSVFPDTPAKMAVELAKQEALLNQIHKEMNEGFVSKSREEQLWEVQRIVTQLKRKLRTLQRSQETTTQRGLDDENGADEVKERVVAAETTKIELSAHKEGPKPEPVPEEVATAVASAPAQDKPQEDTLSRSSSDKAEEAESPHTQPPPPVQATQVTPEWNIEQLRMELEHEELLALQATLQDKIDQERMLIEKLKADISSFRGYSVSPSDESSSGSTPACLSPESETKREQLIEENHILEEKKEDLIRRILEEREACMQLRVHITLFELTGRLQ